MRVQGTRSDLAGKAGAATFKTDFSVIIAQSCLCIMFLCHPPHRNYTANKYGTLWESALWQPIDTYPGGSSSLDISTAELDLWLDLTTSTHIITSKARTFFVAPREGPYTFMMAGDDYLHLNATYLDVRWCCWRHSPLSSLHTPRSWLVHLALAIQQCSKNARVNIAHIRGVEWPRICCLPPALRAGHDRRPRQPPASLP